MKTEEIEKQIKKYDDDLIIKFKGYNNIEIVKNWGDLYFDILENSKHKKKNITIADLKNKLARFGSTSNVMVRKGNSIFPIIKILKRGRYLIIEY